MAQRSRACGEKDLGDEEREGLSRRPGIYLARGSESKKKLVAAGITMVALP